MSGLIADLEGSYMTLLSQKIPTSATGIFYKEIINNEKQVVDKVFIIRYKDEIGRDKLKTIGKYSQGIRIPYCKTIRDQTMYTLVRQNILISTILQLSTKRRVTKLPFHIDNYSSKII